MIRHKKLNNFEYQQIKSIKLFGLDHNSQFKTNNCFFYLFMSNSEKKHVKMGQTCPKIPII